MTVKEQKVETRKQQSWQGQVVSIPLEQNRMMLKIKMLRNKKEYDADLNLHVIMFKLAATVYLHTR